MVQRLVLLSLDRGFGDGVVTRNGPLVFTALSGVGSAPQLWEWSPLDGTGAPSRGEKPLSVPPRELFTCE